MSHMIASTGTLSHPARLSGSVTRALLTGGILAGPLFLGSGFTQAFTRDGFDISRHALSVLANGDLGWIQVATFLLTGLLVIAAAIGAGQVLTSGRGATWVPRLLAIFGAGQIGAGIFRADPALGFPAGTPEDAMTMSWHGALHMVFGQIAFVAFIVACFTMARRFAGQGERGWQVFSVATGILFTAAIVGIATVWNNPVSLAGFYAGVALSFVWLAALSLRLRRETSDV